MLLPNRKIRTGLSRLKSLNLPNREQPLPSLPALKSIAAGHPSAAVGHLFSCPNPDYPSCAAVLYRLARRRLFSDLDSALLTLRSRSVFLPDVVFSALIRHFSLASLPHRALRLFLSIPYFNRSPSLHTFNHLLDALASNGCNDEAALLLHRCSELRIRANHVSYNIVMKGRLKAEGYDAARQVLDEMREKGLRPTVVTYNTLIGFAAQNGELSKATSLKKEMIREGICPNAVTYAILMNGLCSSGKYEAAKKLMFDMEYQGCRTKAVNFGVLMSDCGRRGDFDGMSSLLAEMRKRKIKPDDVTYSILINYLCEGGRVDDAYKVLVEMQVKEGLKPAAAAYRTMADTFCKAREFEKGLGILNAMLTGGHCPRPETFVALALGLAEGGRMEEAAFVLEEMEKRKLELGLEAWNCLIEQVCGEFDEGLKMTWWQSQGHGWSMGSFDGIQYLKLALRLEV